MRIENDEQIKDQVEREVNWETREIVWDARLWELDVKVLVENGVVTLTGTVPTYLQRAVAQSAARHVKGVRGVANRINVHVLKEKGGGAAANSAGRNQRV